MMNTSCYEEYQLSELTRNGELKSLPALKAVHLKTIIELISVAWTGLMTSDKAVVLLNSDEPNINSLMVSRLNNICDIGNKYSSLVRTVTRGTETINHNAVSLEKRPDISVHLTNRPRNCPLKVECKIIEKGKTVHMYCKNGLTRFLDGDYAWNSQEGIMVAYIRNKDGILTHLSPHLETHQKSNPDIFLTEQLPELVKESDGSLAFSLHKRSYENNPGPITVWHLWLGCDSTK